MALMRSLSRWPLRPKASLASLSRCFTSKQHAEPVYELRTYQIVPKNYSEFLKLSNEKISLRLAVSKCLGYWCTDLGGLNEVVHIWEYDDFSHRTKTRKRLAGDQSWQSEYFQLVLPWFQHQENAVMFAFPWWPVRATNPSNGSSAGQFGIIIGLSGS